MKKHILYFLVSVVFVNKLLSQTNVRGWYAKGQVWIVWNTLPGDSSIYEIYESNHRFTSVINARLVGRLFYNEWKAGALRQQVDRSLQDINYRVPKGRSTYRLGPEEGVFVKTPHDSGRKYYAVVKKGDTTVIANNITGRIKHHYLPITDPVQCHPQYDIDLPGNFKGRYYYMWADGRQDYWNSRPDYPVMANVYKNGMPSLFLISEGKEMDTTSGKKIPATLWLHGGGGNATQSKPTSREQVNIEPKKGILVSHNDDFFRISSIQVRNQVVDTLLGFESNSWFFGWAKNENPFDSLYYPAAGDTIINYTQRRLKWINDWLIKHYNVDSNRISVNGHSMGSAGTTALMKAFPGKFATATIFNNGLAGPDEPDEEGSQGARLFGNKDSNLCTNLIRRGDTGNIVHIYQAFNLNDRNSTERDLPLVRMYHGKNDDRGVMRWDPFVVQEYRKADSLGWGMQLYWGERTHGLEHWWDWNDHWSTSAGGDEFQTFRDNVGYEETYRADISYPGFFNHRLDNKNHDPGDGTTGTDTIPSTDSSGGIYAGHDWGTWGGYHEWDHEAIIDEPGKWRITAWLLGYAPDHADISTHDSLTADVSVRRPKNFRPLAGTIVNWFVIDSLTSDTLQRGVVAVAGEGLVVIPGVKMYKETIHKVYIEAATGLDSQQLVRKDKSAERQIVNTGKMPEPGIVKNSWIKQNYPNPFGGNSYIHYNIAPGAKNAYLLITGNSGETVNQIPLNAGTGAVNISSTGLTSGIYYYSLLVGGKMIETRKMVIIK